MSMQQIFIVFQLGIMQLINKESKTAGEIAELEEDYEAAISKAVLTFISETNVKVDLDGFSFQTLMLVKSLP